MDSHILMNFKFQILPIILQIPKPLKKKNEAIMNCLFNSSHITGCLKVI